VRHGECFAGTFHESRRRLEIEAHVAEAGWDQSPRLYALVPTADLMAHEPALAAGLGVEGEVPAGSFTSVEQDPIPAGQGFEDSLAEMMWPEQVVGCAAVVERIMLPPAAEATIPQDPDDIERYVAEHPDRQEVRIVAAAIRDGQSHSTVRSRHPKDSELLEGPDLVPTLIELLKQTLAD